MLNSDGFVSYVRRTKTSKTKKLNKSTFIYNRTVGQVKNNTRLYNNGD